MASYTHTEFQKAIFHQLSFQPTQHKFYTKWDNPASPETGSVLVYERPGYYILSIADYKVPKTFSISFEGCQHLLRFGCLYEGKTNFRVEGIPSRSSSPTSFFVWEDCAKGYQLWNSGNHLKGIEFALFPSYLKKLQEIDSRVADFAYLPKNLCYPFLPPSVVSTMWQLFSMVSDNCLTPLMLEGFLLQCIGILTTVLPERGSSISIVIPTVQLGKRTLTFNSFDLTAIEQAAEILRKNLCNPPSVLQLSKQVFLNEQKLQAGFSLCYHMTIGQYIRGCRMAEATRLLTETNHPIHQIGTSVGYASCASFIKAFRQTYHMTPLAFRNANQENLGYYNKISTKTINKR